MRCAAPAMAAPGSCSSTGVISVKLTLGTGNPLIVAILAGQSTGLL
jgi:hypothetical protein